MLSIEQKETIDSMNILEQVELIHNRAKQLKEEHKTFSNKKAFKIASDEILRGVTWNY